MNLILDILPWSLAILAIVLFVMQFEGHRDNDLDLEDRSNPQQQDRDPFSTLTR